MKLLLITLSLSLFPLLNGQFVEPKFGNVEPSNLLMTKYDKDTTAAALVLFNTGTSEFVLNSDQEFQFVYQRHYQIKIFKKSAFDLADVIIRLYASGTTTEDLNSIKAVTYNMVDGKIVKTKLENNKIYRSKESNYVSVTFAFPEVRDGSVIELSYSITSDLLYNFRGWTFQNNYPALWSQYTYTIPEYFMYRESSKGYLRFDVQKKEPGIATYSIPTREVVGQGLAQRNVAGAPEILKAYTVKTTLAIKDVPAFIPEPNIDCEDNYIQSIEFELSSIKFPNQIAHNYTQTWESVNTMMKDDQDFGELLKASGFVSDTVNALCSNKTSELEKAVSIYNYLQKRMKWNGYYRIFAKSGLKKPFTDRAGTSSEINLLLTMMMQYAGLKANPVLFSTRDNGIAVTFYPTITKYNSVLTRVDINGKTYLLDAINKYVPFGILPPNDINGQGRVVNNVSGDWVNLDAAGIYSEDKVYTLDLSSDGKFTGLISGIYGGYAGIVYRNALNTEKSSDDFIRKMQENIKGLSINKYSISERFNNYSPLTDSLQVEITDHADIIGDKILFNPLLYERMERNGYTLEERKYPINFNYPISEVYKIGITIPAGYIVESLPQPIILKLPDNSISITYKIQSVDNKIQIEYRREINKILFLPEEYKKLKDLYDQLVKKHAEQVILKKTI